MTEAVCQRCGFGLIPGFDSALKNATIKRPGFRDINVKVHHRPHVCQIVLMKRNEIGAREAAAAARENTLRRRVVRKLRSWL